MHEASSLMSFHRPHLHSSRADPASSSPGTAGASSDRDAASISEVNSVPSRGRSDSETSDLILTSSKNVEHVFKHKYQLLKQAYEERMVGMVSLIEDACNATFTDSVAAEMRNDPVTCAYLPNYFTEVFETFLKSSREEHIAELIEKLSNSECDNRTKAATIEHLARTKDRQEVEIKRLNINLEGIVIMEKKLNDLESKYRKLAIQSEADIASNRELSAKVVELELISQRANEDLSKKELETSRLEEDLRLSDLKLTELQETYDAMVKDIAEVRHAHAERANLQNKLNAYIGERAELVSELAEYRARLTAASDELNRCQIVIDEHVYNDGVQKQKIAALMSQVELMLQQDADDNTAAYESMYSKMKTLKDSFIQELKHERALNETIEENLKRTREALTQQEYMTHQLKDELSAISSEHAILKGKFREISESYAELKDLEFNYKTTNAELKSRCDIQETKLRDLEQTCSLQASILEDQKRQNVTKRFESEKMQLSQRMEVLKLHYENDLAEMQNQLRRSQETLTELSMAMNHSAAPEHRNSAIEVSSLNTYHLHQRAADVSMAGAEAADWSQMAQQLKEENDLLRKSLHRAAENIEVLKSMISSRGAVSTTANGGNSAVVDELRAKLANVEAENSKLHSEVRELKLKEERKWVDLGNTMDLNSSVDNVSHSKALLDMKTKFESLLNAYEASNIDLENTLNEKMETISKLEANMDDMAIQNEEISRQIDSLEEQCASKEMVIRKLAGLILSELRKLQLENADVKEFAENALGSCWNDFQNEVTATVRLSSGAGQPNGVAQSKVATQTPSIIRSRRLSSPQSVGLQSAVSAAIVRPSISSPDQLSSPGNIVDHCIAIVTAILDSLVSLGMIDNDFASELIATVASDLQSPSGNFGVLSVNVHMKIRDKVSAFITNRDRSGPAVTLLGSELEAERAARSAETAKYTQLYSEHAVLLSRFESTRIALENVTKDTNANKELHRIEYENQVQKLRETMYDQQRSHASELQSLRAELIRKEDEWRNKLDEALNESKDHSNGSVVLLESKYRAEVSKRQSMQNKLTAQEATHRNVVQALEERQSELLQKLESVELELTKLKLEKLHRFGE